MADTQKNKRPAKSGGGLLMAAARALGSAAGSVAASVGVHETQAAWMRPAAVKGKYPKSNKHRLPRRQKKAAAKAGHTSGAQAA